MLSIFSKKKKKIPILFYDIRIPEYFCRDNRVTFISHKLLKCCGKCVPKRTFREYKNPFNTNGVRSRLQNVTCARSKKIFIFHTVSLENVLEPRRLYDFGTTPFSPSPPPPNTLSLAPRSNVSQLIIFVHTRRNGRINVVTLL